MKQSTLFINHITVIDHSYINEEGCIIGGSFNPNIRVTGNVEEKEQVVVDFSKCKKKIKEVIDNTLDHKLWIINGFSKINDMRVFPDNQVLINTPALQIYMPLSRIAVLGGTDVVEYSYDSVANIIAMTLQQSLGEEFNGATFKVENTETAFTTFFDNQLVGRFRYCHGLKNSSSFGCRNIAHGHLSYIEFELNYCQGEDINMSEAKNLLFEICEYLSESIFTFPENIVHSSKTIGTVGYISDGEEFSITFDSDQQNVLVFDKETTVENLVEEVTDHFREELKAAKVLKVYMSEGLTKGAIATV